MRIRLLHHVAIVVASCSAHCLAQGFGITAAAGVNANLASYDIDGASYNPSCTVNNAGVTLLPDTSYSMTPFFCGGTYWATDPEPGTLYAETSVNHINSLLVSPQTTYISMSSSGGLSDPNVSDGGVANAYASWTDTLTITGPPTGTPVTLRITDYRFGALELVGNTQGSNSQINQQVYVSPSIGGALCSAASFENIYDTPAPSIDAQQTFDLCTTSGATLTLTKILEMQVSGESPSWTTAANLNDTVYIDSLTDDVTIVSESGAKYGSGLTVPASSSGCNGTFNGTFTGDLNISAGQTCIFIGGKITGYVIQTGGILVLKNVLIGEDVILEGGISSVGPLTTIGGDLNIENLPDSTATDEVCTTNVKGNVEVQHVGANVNIGSSEPASCGANVIYGNLDADDSIGTLEFDGNRINGNLQINDNTGATQIYSNSVGGNVLLEGNRGSAQIYRNIIVNDLNCVNNSSISGGLNSAKEKQGQCANF